MASSKLPHRLEKSAHMRAVLVLFASVFAALVIIMASFLIKLNYADQMTLVSLATSQAPEELLVDDKTGAPQQSVFAPDLVALLGMNVDDALTTVGHGAGATEVITTYDSTGTMHMFVTAPLASVPADAYAGTPTLYLTLDKNYKVLGSGFKAGLSFLGYGTLSFSDAVENVHVVEKTLQEAGLFVEFGTVKMPEFKAEYSTYASDGVNLVKEEYEFKGTADGHAWRAVLSFDYSQANALSNLAYTVRTITVHVDE